MDSGCARDVINDQQTLQQPLSDTTVSICLGKGTMKATRTADGQALYAPDADISAISESQRDLQGSFILAHKGTRTIHDQDGAVQAIAHLKGDGLYHLCEQSDCAECMQLQDAFDLRGRFLAAYKSQVSRPTAPADCEPTTSEDLAMHSCDLDSSDLNAHDITNSMLSLVPVENLDTLEDLAHQRSMQREECISSEPDLPRRLPRKSIQETKRILLLAHLVYHHASFRSLCDFYGIKYDPGLAQLCVACLLAFSKKQPHPASHPSLREEPDGSMRWLVTDLKGPIEVSTPGGCRYFMLIVDWFSRFYWTLLLRHKSQALTIQGLEADVGKRKADEGVTHLL